MLRPDHNSHLPRAVGGNISLIANENVVTRSINTKQFELIRLSWLPSEISLTAPIPAIRSVGPTIVGLPPVHAFPSSSAFDQESWP